MKIAFVSQPIDRVVPPTMNSIGIWTYEVARRLSKTNEVTVYTRGGLRTGPEIGEGVRTRFIRCLPNRWMGKLTRWMDRFFTPRRPFFASWLYYLEYSLQVAILTMLQRADVIHLQNYSQFVPIIRFFNPKAKIALHMRCEWLTQLDPAIIAKRLEKADLILGVSDYITDKIRAAYPEQSHKCFSILNGVDTEQFKPACAEQNPGQRTILMVGRISPEKGIHVLIDAFREIANRFPDVMLEIVGPGGVVSKGQIVAISDDTRVNALQKFYQGRPYYYQLLDSIPEDIKRRIHFTGSVGYYATIPYYQQAHILVNPSLSESFGRSLIEGSACGLPLIAARTGGMVELVEQGNNGLFVEPGDANALADALALLLENEPLRKTLAIHGRQRVLERYTWDKICEDIIKAYQSAPANAANSVQQPLRTRKI